MTSHQHHATPEVEILEPLTTIESAGPRHLGERSFVLTCRGTHALHPVACPDKRSKVPWAGERGAARITPSAPFTATGSWLAEIATSR